MAMKTLRPNQWEELLATAARTTAITGTTIEFTLTEGCRGFFLFLDVTGVTDTPGLTPSVNIVDPGGDNDAEPIATFGAFAPSGASHKVYLVYAGAVETGALTPLEMQGVPAPPHGTITVAVADTDSCTYGIRAYGLG